MVDIQSKEVIDKVSDELKIQPSLQIPRELAKQIQLVYDINPSERTNLMVRTNAIDDASEVMLTTSTTKRTFITGAILTVAKDINSTSTFSNIQIVMPTGQVGFILYLRYEPLTAGQHQQVITFPFPIELQKGSAVTLQNGTAVASIDTTGVLFGFETDPQ